MSENFDSQVLKERKCIRAAGRVPAAFLAFSGGGSFWPPEVDRTYFLCYNGRNERKGGEVK